VTRILAIIGSGETSPRMAEMHRELVARLGPRPSAVILDTPYGFQENADAVSDRTIRYFARSVGLDVEVASGMRAPADGGQGIGCGLARLASADWVFAGPGSPSYVASHWRGSAVGPALRDGLARQRVTVVASAAACAIGAFTIPVYEIYKAGASPHWIPGIDLLSDLGVTAAVVTHFDNTEGDTYDTRRCYIGERRLRLLERQLPEDAMTIGIDEQTAVVIDLDGGTIDVRGRGGLTMRRGGAQRTWPDGSRLSVAELRESLPPGGSVVEPPATEPAAPVVRLEARLADAISRHDAGALMDTILETGMGDQAVRIGVALTEAWERGSRAGVREIVEALVARRSEFREQGRYDLADSLRTALASAGIELEDTRDGTRWRDLSR
jgi:cyanophycinase-like exopeptidase